MNNAASLQEKEDMIGFQTKSNFKVAGNDGKSQFNFLQLAEKRQVDLSSISLKEYTLEEVY